MATLLKNFARQLIYNRRGQDLIEYSLISGFLAVMVGALFPPLIMPNISAIFSKVSDLINNAAQQGS
ncbi:MAG: hypothetical protein ABL967_16990 [Bryobacteraceae bacterium]